jgi:hypothetical protein
LSIGEGDLDIMGNGYDLLTAKHLGFGNGAHGQHEGQETSDQNARHGQWQLDLLENLPARGAEIEGGFASLRRHHADPKRHGKQHERNVNVDHAEDDGGAGEQQALRLPAGERFDSAEQHAVLDEEQHPAIKANILRNEERDREEQGEEHGICAEDAHQCIGNGVADERQDQHGHRRQAQGPKKGNVTRALENRSIVIERRHAREGEGARRHDAVPDDREQGGGEADSQKKQHRKRRFLPRTEPQLHVLNPRPGCCPSHPTRSALHRRADPNRPAGAAFRQ